jgi:hypothetical protein
VKVPIPIPATPVGGGNPVVSGVNYQETTM